MAILLSEQLGVETNGKEQSETSSEVKRIRQSILDKMANGSTNGQAEPQPTNGNGKDATS